MPQRGARDALAYVVAIWLTAMSKGLKIVIYCADVAGAFDRVLVERLVLKLQARGLHESIVKLLQSWLEGRQACVLVGGTKSDPFALTNMVFRGQCWDPYCGISTMQTWREPAKGLGSGTAFFCRRP